MRAFLVLLLLITGCSWMDAKQELHNVQIETAAANQELTRKLGTRVHLELHDQIGPDEHTIDVQVQLASMPPDRTADEVNRDATLIVRRHIPHVRNVEVVLEK